MFEEAGPITKCEFAVVLEGRKRWYVLEVHRGENSYGCFYLSGTANDLASAFLAKKTPFGIFLDRIEEYPEEADEGETTMMRPELLEAIKWMRANAPTGIKRKRQQRRAEDEEVDDSEEGLDWEG